MKKIIIAGLLSLLCLATGQVSAKEVVDTATSISFPDKVSFTEDGKTYNLTATGTATRKKLIVKVYSVASYLQDNTSGGNKFERLLNDDYAKQLTITWARGVTPEQIQGGFRESLALTIPATEKGALQPQVDQFLTLFTAPANKGDTFSLRWIPGGRIEKVVDGKVVGTINNKTFAKALWSVWFGDKSVVNKDKLTDQLQ